MVFACDAARKDAELEKARVSATERALACCIESSSEEWLSSPRGLRLPLQPGVWLCHVWNEGTYNGLFLERVRSNRKGKSRGVERSSSKMRSASDLACQFRKWGVTP